MTFAPDRVSVVSSSIMSCIGQSLGRGGGGGPHRRCATSKEHQYHAKHHQSWHNIQLKLSHLIQAGTIASGIRMDRSTGIGSKSNGFGEIQSSPTGQRNNTVCEVACALLATGWFGTDAITGMERLQKRWNS